MEVVWTTLMVTDMQEKFVPKVWSSVYNWARQQLIMNIKLLCEKTLDEKWRIMNVGYRGYGDTINELPLLHKSSDRIKRLIKMDQSPLSSYNSGYLPKNRLYADIALHGEKVIIVGVHTTYCVYISAQDFQSMRDDERWIYTAEVSTDASCILNTYTEDSWLSEEKKTIEFLHANRWSEISRIYREKYLQLTGKPILESLDI